MHETVDFYTMILGILCRIIIDPYVVTEIKNLLDSKYLVTSNDVQFFFQNSKNLNKL